MDTDITTRIQILNLAVNYCMTSNGKHLYPVDVALDMLDFTNDEYHGSIQDFLMDMIESGDFYKVEQPKEYRNEDNVVFITPQTDGDDDAEQE